MKRNWMFTALLVVALAGFTLAATTWDNSFPRFDKLWIGATSDSATETLSDTDVYIKGDVEIDGAVYFDGAVDFDSTIDFSGATFTWPTGLVTAGAIVDVTRTFTLPLQSAFVDGLGPITWSASYWVTSPDITVNDNVPKIVWASGETSKILFTFVVPQDYVSSLAFRIAASSDIDTTPASWAIDWEIYVNNVDTAFDAAAFAQTQATGSSSTPSTKNSEFTFSPDATAAADFASGDTVTVVFWPADTRLPGGPSPGGTTEITSIQVRYTATQ